MTENKKLETKTELYEKLLKAETESQISTVRVEHADVFKKLRAKCDAENM